MARSVGVFGGVSESRIRRQMCDIGRRLWQRQFCAGNDGNHSVRVGRNRVLVTPTGLSKGFMKPGDICVVDMEGMQLSGQRRRTSEILMHLTIFQERPDVRAVIHTHPPHATAFAIAGIGLPSGVYPEADYLLGPVRTAPYVMPGDQRLGDAIRPLVKDATTIILQNHGVVCFGADLEKCCYNMEAVDAYARILMLVKQIGSVRALTDEEMSELLTVKVRNGLADPRLVNGRFVGERSEGFFKGCAKKR
ncbi:MAG: class II aldolase/adducin family protein [Tepidisphaerales bacterium]